MAALLHLCRLQQLGILGTERFTGPQFRRDRIGSHRRRLRQFPPDRAAQEGAGLMRTLVGYVSRALFMQFALMLFGFTALLQLLDLLNNTSKLFARHGLSLSSIL